MKTKPVFALVVGFIIFVVVLLGASEWMGKKSDVNLKLESGSVSKTDIEQIVHEYIANNPQVIVDSVNNYQRMRRDEDKKKQEDYVKNNFDRIANNPNDPRVGKPHAKFQIVEVFDYLCGYCKRMMPVKDQLLASGEDIEIVFKEFPILGEFSEIAAKAGLAVYYIDKTKYLDFHREILNHNGPKNHDVIDKTLAKINISHEQYEAALKDPRIEQTLHDVHGLATAAGIMGTPAYMINGKLFPGAVSYDDIMQEIDRIKKAH